MAPPIYFFAGRKSDELLAGQKVRPSFFDSLGLSELFRDVRWRRQISQFDFAERGPSGGHGLLFTANGRGGAIPKRFGYYPDQQTWQEHSDGVWLGFDPQDPPGPEDLERSTLFPGQNVVIDERTWKVPVVRRFDGSSSLPSRVGWNRDGKFEVGIKAEYRAVWEATAPACALFLGQKPEVSLEGLTDLALRGLALNYRVGRVEQTAFELLDNTSWEAIVSTMVDLDWAAKMAELAAKKKREAP